MATGINREGGCLCGAVRYRVTEDVYAYGTCHCDMCRRWTGGPLFATEVGLGVEFEGEENIGTFRSSEWAERGFCKICGSCLFYKIIPNGHYMMAVGGFDDQTDMKMTGQVFIDEKPDGYAFVNETKNMTGAEVMAMYMPDSD